MNENIIGRGYEIKRLEKFYNSPKSEFITIYGRRRVGKTYLINQFFKDRFAFDASGIIDGSKEAQFYSFYDSLTKYGYEGEQPKNWFEMFSALSKLLEKQNKNETFKRIHFYSPFLYGEKYLIYKILKISVIRSYSAKFFLQPQMHLACPWA